MYIYIYIRRYYEELGIG